MPDPAGYRHVLDNGVPVWIAEDRSLPLVDVSITVRAGAFLEPADKAGLASLTGSLMRVGGAGERTAEQFDERVDFLAANLGSFSGDTSSGASLNCYSGVLDESLDLLFAMLKSPRFQQDRLDIEKDDALESMKQRNDRPTSIARREWQWLMFGREHFTSRLTTKASLDAISRQDLVDFHARWWRPENMIVTVSGDVDTQDILKRLNARFAGWKPEGPKPAWPPAAPDHAPQPGVYYVQKDIPQGRVQIGHLGMKRDSWDDPDAYALAVMNDILGGGGFTSRLVKRIRSDEGLAYSAGSAFGVGEYWREDFSMFFQSKSPTVAFAAKICETEMKRMRDEKVSAEELRVAKNSFVDVFPRSWERPEQIVGRFAGDEYVGRPHDYWKTYRDRMRAVTAEDVQRVAKKYLHPDRLVWLIVGDWEEIRPGDADGRASMAEIGGGEATEIPLRDPLTLEPAE